MDHHALVTGGGRGIGRAIVERLRADGAEVLTCGRGDRPADLPRDVHWVSADIARPSDCDRLVGEFHDRIGSVTLLVNNAGVQIEKDATATTDEDWDLLIGTNCRGIFTMTRAVLPDMIDRGGVIVNVGSTSGFAADRSMPLYNASKAFVHGLTRSIAVDHGPQVRCNAVSPGWVSTGMADDAFAAASDPAAARRDALARHPAGRLGLPEDIANAVAWLASEESAWMTGQCLIVDGGLLAGSPVDPHLW